MGLSNNFTLITESEYSSACDNVFKLAIFRVIIGLSDNSKVRAPMCRCDSKEHKTRRER